ncbi:MAG: proprotein convertase P-domain-containing protein [Rudaea sp.]|nr:proprotein convertase P-domain-containing protein [Rudaea sp.]
MVGHAQYVYTSSGGTITNAISSSPADIPSTTTFEMPATGFFGQIIDARVSLYITYAADQDLSIVLISPSGVQVPLLQNRENAAGTVDNSVGATGADFGTGCGDSARTVFEDAASNEISTSTAPYVGLFKPVYPFEFAALDGESASQANGEWQLQITDFRNAAPSGNLTCWSLFLDSTDLIFRDGFELLQ